MKEHFTSEFSRVRLDELPPGVTWSTRHNCWIDAQGYKLALQQAAHQLVYDTRRVSDEPVDPPIPKAPSTFDFGTAIREMKEGKRVCRAGWNGKGLWLELQRPDAHSKMTLPYIFMSYPADAQNTPADAQNTPGARVPWLASQTDMLAEDWSLYV